MSRLPLYLITYLAYVSLTIARQSLAISKSSLLKVTPFDTEQGSIWLGMLDTLFLSTYTIGSFSSGWLGDRISPVILLSGSMLASAILCMSVAVGNPAIPAFAILFLLAGLVQSAGWTACLSLIGSRPSGLALGVWTTHGSVGGIIAKGIGAMFLAYGTWKSVFTGLGTVCLVGGIIVTLLLQQWYPNISERSVSIVSPPPSNIWTVLWQTPTVLAFSTSFFFVKLTVYCLLGWLPTYLTSIGYTPTDASLLAIIYDIGSVVGGIGAGYWMDRTGKGATICVQALLASAIVLGTYILYGTIHVAVQIILLLLIGCTLSVPYILISGKITTEIGDRYPASRSTISGIINGCGSLGAVVQGIGVGALGTAVDWSYIIGCISLCTLLSAILLLQLAWNERGDNTTFIITTPCTDLTSVSIPTGTRTLIASGIGLLSLKGCPSSVTTANFSRNNLVSLEGISANSALLSLDVSYNRLTSLAYVPSQIQRLRASHNRISSLVELSSCINLRSLGISGNHLINLEGCPLSVRSIVCSHNFINSWNGFPAVLDRLYITSNHLHSLEGMPVVRSFDCSGNVLMSLHGVVEGIEELVCCDNRLTTLEYCPSTVVRIRCSGNAITTLEREWSATIRLLDATKNPLVHGTLLCTSHILEVCTDNETTVHP